MENIEKEGNLLNILSPEQISETFDQIGGYEEIKNTLKTYINLLNKIDELKGWNIKVMGKLLLHGPPGTGKTMLVRAFAKETGKKLIILNSTAIMSKYISESGKNLQKTFEIVKKNYKRCIFFIDEFDSLAKTRESIGDHDEMKRIVNTLLQSFDEISLVDDEILTVAATNFEIVLDSAIWRRFDEIIYVNLPNAEQRTKIFKVLVRKIPAHIISFNPGSLDLLKETEHWSGADLQRLINRAIIGRLAENSQEQITEETLLELIKEKKITSTSMRIHRPFHDMQEKSLKKGKEYESKFRKMLDTP